MLAKMPIERRAVRRRQRLALATDHPARALGEIADAQRRQIGGDDGGQAVERRVDEGCAAGALLAKRLQRAQCSAQLALGKPGKHRGHGRRSNRGLDGLCARK